MKKKTVLFLLVISLLLSACATDFEEKMPATGPVEQADLSNMDFSFSDREISGEIKDDTVQAPQAADSVITIDQAGVFEFSGEMTDRIVVSAGEKDKVQIVLAGAKIQNSSGPAIFIQSADKVYITAKEGTENVITDGKSYSVTDKDSTVDGAIFSKADLAINGEGSLFVTGNFKHGIVSKDDLVLAIKSLQVDAKNVGINGKDCVKIAQGEVIVNAGSDGIRSDNTEDTSRGFVYVDAAKVSVTSGNDGVQAETVVKLDQAELTVLAGGGSARGLSASTESYKGIKAVSDILISDGSITVDSRDDCLHSNHTVTLSGGTLFLSSGDDGIHADTDLSVSGGKLTISKSYEALEGTRVMISGGTLDLTSSDDGINAAGGNDGSGFSARPGMGQFSSSSGLIAISGGYLVINASGDGLDANGSVAISGGVTLLSGPTGSGNGAFDYDSAASVTGGVLVALGSTGMAQCFTEATGQGAALIGFSSQTANSSFALCDSAGNVLLSFDPPKSYQSALVTCPEMQPGGSYQIVTGGTVFGADEYGFCQNTTLTGGNTIATFELSSNLYSSGSGGMGGNMRPGGEMDHGPMGGGPGGKPQNRFW